MINLIQGPLWEVSTILTVKNYSFLGLPCCDKHRYTGSGRMWQNEDTTADFNLYTVEWTPKNMIFKFNNQQKYEINIDKIMQSGTYSKNGQPFDKTGFLIKCLNLRYKNDGPMFWRSS